MTLKVFIILFNANFLSCVAIISDLSEMVCSNSDTALNISIPVIMISKSGGEALNKSMGDGQKGEHLNVLISNYLCICMSVVYVDC